MLEDAEEPLLTAARMLAWRSGGSLPQLPEAAVLTHQGSLLPRRRPWVRSATTAPFSFDTQEMAGGVTLAAVRGVGAPATAIAIEELAVAGVRHLIAVDIAGSIDAGVHTGDVVVVEHALAHDGTSRHYTGEAMVWGSDGMTLRLRERLAADGVAHTVGGVWTTDGVYRERPSDVAAARSRGALVVDMETACVFAVARALGVQAATVLVVADELHGGWWPPADMRVVQERLRKVLGAAVACLTP